MLPFLFAVGTGILSGWGVGGGTMLLLCMTLILGVEHRTAQAVNLLFFLPTAAVSVFFHRKKGRIDGKLWKRMALPGAGAALAAAFFALGMDVSFLRVPFGIFLLWGGCTVLRGLKNGT